MAGLAGGEGEVPVLPVQEMCEVPVTLRPVNLFAPRTRLEKTHRDAGLAAGEPVRSKREDAHEQVGSQRDLPRWRMLLCVPARARVQAR